MERWENLLWSRIFRSASGVVSDDLFHEFAVVCLIVEIAQHKVDEFPAARNRLKKMTNRYKFH